jgi:hypothetical protein
MTVGGQQNGRGAPDVFLPTVGRHRFQASAVGGAGVNATYLRMPQTRTRRELGESSSRIILPSDFID